MIVRLVVLHKVNSVCGRAPSTLVPGFIQILHPTKFFRDRSSYQIYPKVTRLARAWLLAIVVVMHAATVHVRVLSTNCTVFSRHFRDDLFFLFF